MLAGEDGDLWRKAVSEEYGSLVEKKVLTVEDRPNYCTKVRSKRIFNANTSAQGFIGRRTVRFDAKDFHTSGGSAWPSQTRCTLGSNTDIYGRYLMGVAVCWVSQGQKKNTTLLIDEVGHVVMRGATQGVVTLGHLLRTYAESGAASPDKSHKPKYENNEGAIRNVNRESLSKMWRYVDVEI